MPGARCQQASCKRREIEVVVEPVAGVAAETLFPRSVTPATFRLHTHQKYQFFTAHSLLDMTRRSSHTLTGVLSDFSAMAIAQISETDIFAATCIQLRKATKMPELARDQDPWAVRGPFKIVGLIAMASEVPDSTWCG